MEKTDEIVVHADLLSEIELIPLPIAGGSAPVLRAIESGLPVRVVGIDRAQPRVVARLCEALGGAGDGLRRAFQDGEAEFGPAVAR